MSSDKNNPGGAPFPVVHSTNFTTASADVVVTLTPSPNLLAKTELCVLSTEDGVSYLRVYRKSSTAPGQYSCERYKRKGDHWSDRKEEDVKYALPQVPPGAKSKQLGGVTFYTFHELTASDEAALLSLIASSPKPGK